MNKGNTYNKNQQALITCNNILYEGGATLDRILYPVGSIYMSVNSTNPSQLFGGTWQEITGRFLYCTNNSKELGGSNTTGSTVLDVSQIPGHQHMGRNYSNNWNAGISIPPGRSYAKNYAGGNGQWAYSADQWIGGSEINEMVETGFTGGGQGHTHPRNLPPYFTVYCWYRVS